MVKAMIGKTHLLTPMLCVHVEMKKPIDDEMLSVF